MELYGFGEEMLRDNYETIQQPKDSLQSPHLQEEPIGNKLIVDGIIQQQLHT